jgi:adenylate cyclase
MEGPATKPPPQQPTTWRVSIATVLGAGLGGLVFLAVGSVLLIALYANFVNTTELLRDKSRLLLGSLAGAIERHLRPVAGQAHFVAELIALERIDPTTEDFARATAASLGATPQLHALIYVDREGTEAGAVVRDGKPTPYTSRWQPGSNQALVLEQALRAPSPSWGPPTFVDGFGTVINFRRPVIQAGRVVGVTIAAARIDALARFVADLATEFGQTTFVLYGREHILTHPDFEHGLTVLSADHPLPRLDEIGDPILAGIWQPGWEGRRLYAGDGHQAEIGGTDYIFLYETLERYGEQTWWIGSYFQEADIAGQIRRFIASAVVGGVGLVAAVVSALLLGHMLRRPIDRLAAAASKVRVLDLENVPPMGRSRFRELDAAGRAFDAMVNGLRAFRLYVPRDLVSRLVGRGRVEDLESEIRLVTVMFSDVAGFTSQTERLGAEATAAFLNAHFDLVTGCVEAEGGIVDKFIGDGVMALWGAIEDQPDQAVRAARAARAIAAAVRAANTNRAVPVRIRIGLHAGQVLVGNIGSRSRMNYTVIGDAVNAAERLESLGKELAPGRDVTILISEVIRNALPDGFEVESLGAHQLRGRESPTEVFRLRV